MNQKESSFTLIELLIVIAIIGILAGILIVSMTGATNNANDARRKADINQLVQAILIAKTQDGTLPADSANCSLGSTCTGIQASLASKGITTFPKDPTTGNYYVYNRVSADDFTLTGTMSNSTTYVYSSANSKYSVNTPSPCISGGGLTCTETTVGSYKVDKYTLSGTTTGTFTWVAPAGVTSVEYLVVAGGGGGGNGGGAGGGGGGAGGLIHGYSSTTANQSFSLTVGAGGAGADAYTSHGANGADSVFGSVTAIGGGGGGSYSDLAKGNSGGSGGGAGYIVGGSTGGAGTAGQGYSGGNSSDVNPYPAGGGGGAGGVGGNNNGANAGNGGDGLAYSIEGTSIYYAGGGGGGVSIIAGSKGTGGLGGGGDGEKRDSTSATSGTNGLGGGGGGGATVGKNGGSGTVIIKYLAP